MSRIQLLLVLLISVFLLSACSFSLAEDITPPPGSEQQIPLAPSTQASSEMVYPLVPPDPQAGAPIYVEKCAPCHGETGMGDGPRSVELNVPVAAIGSAQLARQSTPSAWHTILTQGNLERFMPPFPSLSNRQKWDVIAYVYTLSMNADSISQGQALYLEHCASCHGEKGRGDGPEAVGLSSPPSDLTDQARMAEKSTAALYETITNGIFPNMPPFGDTLGENERWALASYLRLLTFAPTVFSGTDQTSTSGTYPPPVSQDLLSHQVTTTLTTTLPTSGSVAVTVINGSGGEAINNATVTLYGFHEMTLVYTQALESGENGLYLFEDVEMPAGRVFLVGVEYGGGVYGSDIVVAEQGPADLSLEVTAYETSTDPSPLTIDRIHIFMDFIDAKRVQVIEVFIVSNPTNRSIVAKEEGGPVVFFPLPKEAENLQFQDGALGKRYLTMPGGFADTLMVEPGMGQYQVVVAFEMPYNRGLDFIQAIALPTEAVVVMFPDLGIRIKSDFLQNGGVRDFQGTSYQVYNGGKLEAGNSLVFSLSGQPKLGNASSPTIMTSTQNLAIGLGVLGLALIMTGIWLYRRVKSQATASEASSETAEPLAIGDELPDEPETLMDAIITLDDLYQAGELPEEAYKTRRALLKSKLAQVLEKKA